MDHQYTIRIDKVNVVIRVAQVSQNQWTATAEYQGKKYVASAETVQMAHDKLVQAFHE